MKREESKRYRRLEKYIQKVLNLASGKVGKTISYLKLQKFKGQQFRINILLKILNFNCIMKWSFSPLKRIKNYFCLKLAQDKFSFLAIGSTESEMAYEIKLEDIIQTFAEKRRRK